MAENKKSFILYCDLIHTIDKIPNEQAGKLFKHILEYVNDLNPNSDDIIVNIAFEPIKQQLKRDLNKWEGERQNRSDAGKKGMASRWKKDITNDNSVITKDNSVISVITNDNKLYQGITKITDNVTVNVNDNDNVIKEEIISFDSFWDIYDKKISKDKCLKKFNALSNNDKLKIKETIKDYVASTPDVKFRKNPETYLNNKSWNDEIVTHSNVVKKANKLDEIQNNQSSINF